MKTLRRRAYRSVTCVIKFSLQPDTEMHPSMSVSGVTNNPVPLLSLQQLALQGSMAQEKSQRYSSPLDPLLFLVPSEHAAEPLVLKL